MARDAHQSATTTQCCSHEVHRRSDRSKCTPAKAATARRLPAREVRAARRARRRRRRPRRQHLRARRPQHQHARSTIASRASTAPRTARKARARIATAAAAEDIELRVPVGTVIRDADTGELVADLAEHDGDARCSRKAARAASATCISSRASNRAPRQFTRGRAGRESRKLALELQSARRRRPARPAERRQIDLHPRGLCSAAEGRGLSVHHAASQSRRGARR